MNSGTLFSFASVLFLGSMIAFAWHFVRGQEGVRRAATITAALGFLLQTFGLAARWYESGLHEVAAQEAAEQRVLIGLERFVTLSSHPPWSNLYEIMVFMSWGIVLAFLVSEVRWRVRGAGALAMAVALLAFGIASLTLDASVEPLVPALRSYWLHFHVFSASVGYAAGLIAAIASLLYLAASGVDAHRVGLGSAIVTTVVAVLIGRGPTLFASLEYRARVLAVGADGARVLVHAPNAHGGFEQLYAAMPFVGFGLLLTIALGVAAIAMHWQVIRSESNSGLATWARLVSVALFAVFSTTIAVMLGLDLVGAQAAVDIQTSAMAQPGAPHFFGLASNQWDIGLMLIAWLGLAFCFLVMRWPEALRSRLPQHQRLDSIAHKSVLVAFTFVGILIVTGAIWAHYAWGRYWGWDPKETGSLVIWFVYAAYLHTRITHGLRGAPSALIAILGFFIVLAGFLGVNLGWFSAGLHSYGAG